MSSGINVPRSSLWIKYYITKYQTNKQALTGCLNTVHNAVKPLFADTSCKQTPFNDCVSRQGH